MSYIFNNNVNTKYSDSANLDAFGRLRVSEISNIIELKQVYDNLPLIISEVTGGTITSVHSQQYAKVTMTTSASGSYVVRQSKNWATYQPGKSQIFEGSFGNFQIQTNVIKRVGLFNSTTATTYDTQLDGCYLESNGVTNKISFVIQRSGTTVFTSESSTWDSSEYDPTSIDWSKVQIFFLDYQWLGVGRARFGLTIDGVTYIFATHSSTNSETEVYMSSPNQPIRYEIRQVGAGSGTFDMICSQVSSEGSTNDLTYTTSIPHTGTTTLNTSGTKYPYIGVRLKSGFRASTGYVKSVFVLNTSNDDYLISVEYNPTLSSTPSWTSIANTPYEYSLGSGSSTITSAGYIISSLIGEAGTSALTQLEISDNPMKIGTSVSGVSDEVWICITPLGATATFVGTTNINYEI